MEKLQTTEFDIALNKVHPFIRDTLGWPEALISPYGRVPVQIGGSTVWVDFVCYISKGQKAVPWVLFEVKKSGVPLEQALPQAESYSLIFGTPFFSVTDGDIFMFYVTGEAQGKSIGIEEPPKPLKEYLDVSVEYINFPMEIDDLIR